jgi:ketosteroid isomerase-like protein
MMSEQQNIAIAKKLLEGIAGGQDPDTIAVLFGNNLVFEIQGDDGVLPWIGRKTGYQAIADFIRDIRALTEPISFDVEDILASESRAAIVGALRTAEPSSSAFPAANGIEAMTHAAVRAANSQEDIPGCLTGMMEP